MARTSKHAGPNAPIWLRLYVEADQLPCRYATTGGFSNGSQARDGIGPQHMRDRIGAAGGAVDVTSQYGAGTLVHAAMPAHTGEPAAYTRE